MWALTEILSLFSVLNFRGILVGWICYDIILLAYLAYLYKYKGLSKPKISLSIKSRWIYFIGFILVVTFFTAIVYPPNNWDSMTYHLPRIEHWIQNQNLDHYYTSNIRQTVYAPFAEITILHNRVLSGDDWLMNLVQWFAFSGIIICISKIVSRLGMNRKMQIIAALFFATLPMAILQSSSTQNDLFVTFWIVCLFDRLLAWKDNKQFRLSIDIGIALGLAILSKGTAYPIAATITLFFAVLCIKQYKKYLVHGCVAACICLAINAPHYVRNYNMFKNPVQTNAQTMSPFTLESAGVSLISNIYTNIPVPVPYDENINEHLSGVDKTIFPYGPLYVYSLQDWLYSIAGIAPFDEDVVKNPFHMLFVIASFFIVFIRRNIKKTYSLIVLLSWGVFIFCIPWQPWVTRLQVPLFALSAPVFALAINSIASYRKLINICLYLICIYALFPLFLNQARPLLYFPSVTIIQKWTSKDKSIWNRSREELYFNTCTWLYDDYTNACKALKESESSHIGIIIGLDTWEYPLWRYLRHNNMADTKICALKVDSVQPGIDALFILDGMITEPRVLIKDKNVLNKWNVLYPIGDSAVVNKYNSDFGL